MVVPDLPARRGRRPKIVPTEVLTEIENVPQEKPLNDLILEMKKLVKNFQNQMEIKILENGGKVKEIQITTRIQI